MKTKIILTCCFVAVFAAIQLSACNKGGNQQAESANIAEAQTQENTLNEQVTYDLAFLELHGPVHMVKESYIDVNDKYSWDGRTHTFSKDGKIVKVGNYDPFDVSKDIYDDPEQTMEKYTRDSEGRITEMAMWESIENYTWKDMRLAGTEWMAEGESGTEQFHYDAKGFIDYADCVEKNGQCRERTLQKNVSIHKVR